MRAVLQRVSSARVLVDGSVTGEIGPGLVVLLAVGRGGLRGKRVKHGGEDRESADLRR